MRVYVVGCVSLSSGFVRVESVFDTPEKADAYAASLHTKDDNSVDYEFTVTEWEVK